MVSSSHIPRIAFVTTVYDHTDVGGGTFVRYLRSAADEGRLNVVFYSDDIADPGASYERKVTVPGSMSRLPGGWVTRARYYEQALRADQEESRYDVIWHNNAITGLFGVAKERLVPVVGMINDYNNAESSTPFAMRRIFGTYRSLVRFGWHQVERYVARRADCLIANSHYMADRIRRIYDVEEQRVKLLYKGVDLDAFSFVDRSLDRRKIRLLFVKRDYQSGGLPDLLAALSDFAYQVELTVVGPHAESHRAIREMARVHGIENVRLTGPISRQGMPAYFRDHDILCIPSRSEALGVSLMEALASGLPAVGCAVGGVPEVLDHGRAGWLVEPNNASMLARELRRVIEDDEERVRKTRHGRVHVARFSHGNMIERMLEIARELSSSHAVPTYETA